MAPKSRAVRAAKVFAFIHAYSGHGGSGLSPQVGETWTVAARATGGAGAGGAGGGGVDADVDGGVDGAAGFEQPVAHEKQATSAKNAMTARPSMPPPVVESETPMRGTIPIRREPVVWL